MLAGMAAWLPVDVALITRHGERRDDKAYAKCATRRETRLRAKSSGTTDA